MIIHCDSVRYIWEVLENNEYSFVFNDLTVVDLGCNIGTFSLWIYPRCKEIHAVDMLQEHIDNFNKTIKDNGFNRIKTYTEKITGGLNDFLQGHAVDKVDILKVDIEGDEYELFKDEGFPKEKVRTIIGEYHSKPIKVLLEEMGYQYTEYPQQHFLARL